MDEFVMKTTWEFVFVALFFSGHLSDGSMVKLVMKTTFELGPGLDKITLNQKEVKTNWFIMQCMYTVQILAMEMGKKKKKKSEHVEMINIPLNTMCADADLCKLFIDNKISSSFPAGWNSIMFM